MPLTNQKGVYIIHPDPLPPPVSLPFSIWLLSSSSWRQRTQPCPSMSDQYGVSRSDSGPAGVQALKVFAVLYSPLCCRWDKNVSWVTPCPRRMRHMKRTRIRPWLAAQLSKFPQFRWTATAKLPPRKWKKRRKQWLLYITEFALLWFFRYAALQWRVVTIQTLITEPRHCFKKNVSYGTDGWGQSRRGDEMGVSC